MQLTIEQLKEMVHGIPYAQNWHNALTQLLQIMK